MAEKTSFNIKMFLFTLWSAALLSGCSGIGPVVAPELKKPEYIPQAKFDRVVVSNFFKTTYFSGLRFEQMPYYDTKNYDYWQTSGQDISGLVSQNMGSKGLMTKAMKNYPSSKLNKGEILVSGVISVNNINDISPLHIPLFFILIGNVLPNPAGYTSGANVNYRYEIIDDKSNIIYQSGNKHFQVTYKHLWVWGSIFNRDRHYDDGSEQAMKMVMDEITEVTKGLNR